MNLYIAVALLAVTAAATEAQKPVPAASGGVCPGAFVLAGQAAMTPFAPNRFSWFKSKHKLHDIDYKQIRPLDESKPRDRDVCQRIRNAFAGTVLGAWSTRPVFYRAQNYFIAVFVDGRDPAREKLFHPQVYVFDSQLKYVASVAPKL